MPLFECDPSIELIGFSAMGLLDIPYPDDVFYGMFFEFARHFLPDGTAYTVEYDGQLHRDLCGGDRTVLHITW